MTKLKVSHEAAIPSGHDCYDDTHSNDLEVSSDPSSPFAYASPLETSTSLGTSKDFPIIHNSSLRLALSGELEEGDGFETDGSIDNQCGTLVESEDTFTKEHSLDEPFDVEFSEVSPHMELDDPISDESFPNLAPTLPILPLSSPLSIFLPFLDPPESTFIKSTTYVLDGPCLD